MTPITDIHYRIRKDIAHTLHRTYDVLKYDRDQNTGLFGMSGSAPKTTLCGPKRRKKTMLYKRNRDFHLDDELFKNPTSEYRGAPFWSWNCELDREELLRQIDCLHKMGFGGFHMHSRTGMATP